MKVLAHLVVLLVLFVSTRALAFTPPAMTAHVTDTAGKLTEAERLALDRKLEDYRLRTTNEIAVFLPASLEGETIEEVGIETGRAWQLGVKGKDNGVLLIVAPVERKARIEVGRGVEGALTDLQSNDIIRQKVRPNLTPGHENYDAAVEAATDAIMSTLDAGGAVGGKTAPAPLPSTGSAVIAIVMLLLVFLVPIILFATIIRALVRAFTSHGPDAQRGWASGSTWSNDSSWSSSSSSSSYDSGWGGGGGGGGFSSGGDSGFSGGGGSFGGGGSSDSF